MIYGILAMFLTWECVVSLTFLWMVYKVLKWWQNPLRRIPGPRGSLIFGNMHELAPPNDAQQVFLKWREEYGEVFKTWDLFAGYHVHLSNPDHLKKVLVKDSINYDRPNLIRMQWNEISPGNGVSVFDANGKSHALQRKMLNPAFSYANIQKFIYIFQTKADELVQCWNSKISQNNGNPIEIKVRKDLNSLTLDIIGESAFDYKFNSLSGFNSEESQATDRLLRCAFDFRRKGLEMLLPILRIFPSKSREEIKATAELFKKTIFNVIRQRRQALTKPESPKKEDLLQLFIEMSEKEGLMNTDEDLFAQIEVFMIAGYETTSTSLTWAILLLSKFPHIQSKVREEIKKFISDDKELTHENLSKLKYLDNCIKESMRLYPSTLHVRRQPTKDIQMGSFLIPKGTLLLLHIGLAQRDERFWERPDVFDPDRFENSYLGEKKQTFQYQHLPFSRGPRMCIGYKFAETEMKVALVKLLRSFTFRLGKNQTGDFSAERVLTLRPNPSPEIEISRLD